MKSYFKYTTKDVLWDDGTTVFFSKPTVPVAQTAEQLPGVVAPQVKMITIVAVSCLALLIGLVVLVPKLLRRFLP